MRSLHPCKIAECGELSKALDLCNMHYLRFKKHGDPLKTDKPRHMTEKHGMWQSPEYNSWANMIARCYYSKTPRYQQYGGRGITVCDRWRYSFKAFYEDMGNRPTGTSIDRIDVNGNYEPVNCRWADIKTQSYNKRLGSRNKSGHHGVSFAKERSKWVAFIRIDGKPKNLGYFIEKVDAIAARKSAEALYF